MRISSFNTNSNQKFSNNSKSVVKENFSASLSEVYKSSTRESLDKSLNKIREMGDILISTQSYSDIVKYK